MPAVLLEGERRHGEVAREQTQEAERKTEAMLSEIARHRERTRTLHPADRRLYERAKQITGT